MDFMTGREISDKIDKLEYELFSALSTFEKKSRIFEIRKEILALQEQCPHYDQYEIKPIEGHRCPYCGKRVF